MTTLIKQTPIISIIIPIYRTELYLEECLNSVLSQRLGRSYSLQDIEIICVDDESPDNSKEIVLSYVKNNSNIIFLEQKNQGQSAARNNALKISRGKYILFLDSDDLLPEEALISLLKVADETGSEVIVSHAKAFNARRSWYIESHAEVASASLRKVKFFHRSILINSPPPWAKLFSRDLLLRNNIQFPEGIKLAEDWIFVIHAMYKANHISSTPEVTYLYRGRDDEDNPSCTQIVNEKIFTDLLKVYNLTKQFNLPTNQNKYAKLFILRGILYRLNKFTLDNNIQSCKPIYKQIKKFLNEEIGLDMIYIFTPARRLPLLLIYHSFYSEAHRVMNGIFKATCLSNGKEANERYIIEDYKSLKNKTKNKQFKKVAIKKLNYLKWSFKYQLSKSLSKLLYRNKEIHLIGERLGNTANDSSYYLFKHIQKNNNKPNKNLHYYYVIKKNAETIKNLSGLENVVTYGSFKHYLIFNAASKYIFSDSMRDVFHRWKDVHHDHEHKKKIFLQHGVFALNRAAGYYDANSMLRRHEMPDKFIVSSEHERNLVCKNFGFSRDQVAVTGLSRFDNLPKRAVKPSNKILIMFTWRESLNNVNKDNFLKSKYFKKLNELLSSSELQSTLQEFGYTIEACLHHKLNKHIELTQSSSPYKIHSMNDTDVQSLIINSDIMITDFSSASFDFLYQNKPVLYYWFDEEKFFAKRGGPLINPLEDMPGVISKNLNSLISEIRTILSFYGNEKPLANKKADIFFKYKDNNNSKRIVSIIENCS